MTGRAILTAINTKILLTILAALIAIGGALVYQRHQMAKTAAILQQQQKKAEQQKERDKAFRQQVERDKKNHNSSAANEGKTWQKYIP
ncbi:MAG: hypothetical protein WA700_07615 [Acidobacteriaceae bacterium]